MSYLSREMEVLFDCLIKKVLESDYVCDLWTTVADSESPFPPLKTSESVANLLILFCFSFPTCKIHMAMLPPCVLLWRAESYNPCTILAWHQEHCKELTYNGHYWRLLLFFFWNKIQLPIISQFYHTSKLLSACIHECIPYSHIFFLFSLLDTYHTSH